MTNHPEFVYTDDASIDDEFKCLICNEPFEKPTCTPCDHTFCRSCIEQWLRKNTDENRLCPICRHSLSIENDLKPASRIISNRIDRYLVKCLACEVDNIPRGLFANHVEKACIKANVSCLASDISCPWIGSRDLLNNHVKLCPYQQIRPALETILVKNTRLEQQLIDQQQQIININKQYQEQQHQINQLTSMIEFLKIHNNVPIKRTITFEDLVKQNLNQNTYHPMPSNYAGFKWLNAAYMPRQHGKSSYPNTGFATAFEEDIKCVAFNFGCKPISLRDCHSTFCILSFEATCAFQDNVILTVLGRCAGTTIHKTNFILRSQELKLFNLNWNDIDELEFLPKDGEQLPTSEDTDRHVVLAALNFG